MGTGFQKRSCLINILERDGDSSGRHPALGRRRERGKAAGEIGRQVFDLLQADMEAQRRSPGSPFRGGAIARAIERDHQALVSAPRKAHAEQLERIEQRVDRRFTHRLEHHAPVKSRCHIA